MLVRTYDVKDVFTSCGQISFKNFSLPKIVMKIFGLLVDSAVVWHRWKPCFGKWKVKKSVKYFFYSPIMKKTFVESKTHIGDCERMEHTIHSTTQHDILFPFILLYATWPNSYSIWYIWLWCSVFRAMMHVLYRSMVWYGTVIVWNDVMRRDENCFSLMCCYLYVNCDVV